MTNVVKWYKKYDTWNRVIAILTPIAGGEIVAAFANVQLPTWVHVVVGFSALALLVLKVFVKDEDGDGILDALQKKIKTKTKPKQDEESS